MAISSAFSPIGESCSIAVTHSREFSFPAFRAISRLYCSDGVILCAGIATWAIRRFVSWLITATMTLPSCRCRSSSSTSTTSV